MTCLQPRASSASTWKTADGQSLRFDEEFDAVFSNAALHWMNAADHVIDGVWRALKPGGRFVAEFGGHGNVAAIVTAMRAVGMRRGGDPALAGPWFFPFAEVYADMLAARGFEVKRIGLVSTPDAAEDRHEGLVGGVPQAVFRTVRR
jgi:SAM-dependent methyltransferase